MPSPCGKSFFLYSSRVAADAHRPAASGSAGGEVQTMVAAPGTASRPAGQSSAGAGCSQDGTGKADVHQTVTAC